MKVIFFNGRPKSGIHLLKIAEIYGKTCFDPAKDGWTRYLLDEKIRERLFNKGAFFLSGHYQWNSISEQKLRSVNCKMVLIIRDLRDCITAAYRAFEYGNVNAGNAHHRKIFATYNGDRDRIIEDMILDTFAGGGTAPKHFRSNYFPWMNTDFCYVTRFEDLVGSKGGGDDSIQLKEFQQICEFINLPQVDKWYKRRVTELYSTKAPTFIPGGGVGSYKNYFNKKNIEIFERVAGGLHRAMGYK